jgi:uncharacterized Zn ribbon protein
MEYNGNKQKLNLNNKDANGNQIEDLKLVAHVPDNIIAGKEAVFKLTTSIKNYRIIRAYFDCRVDTNSFIDTVSYKLSNCDKELAVIKDTIVVAFKPQRTGDFIFPETIVGISRGKKDGVFRYHTGKFRYKVIEKEFK